MKLELSPPALSPLARSVLVGLVQLVLVASLAGKLWYDRSTLPRVWVRCTGVDPDDPLRGRYVELRLTVPLAAKSEPYGPARLRVVGDQLVAERAPHDRTSAWDQVSFAGRESVVSPFALLDPPVAVFLPEHVPDPTRRLPGEELWLEVTVPDQSPPRPIRLGVKHGDSAVTPLLLD